MLRLIPSGESSVIEGGQAAGGACGRGQRSLPRMRGLPVRAAPEIRARAGELGEGVDEESLDQVSEELRGGQASGGDWIAALRDTPDGFCVRVQSHDSVRRTK